MSLSARLSVKQQACVKVTSVIHNISNDEVNRKCFYFHTCLNYILVLLTRLPRWSSG